MKLLSLCIIILLICIVVYNNMYTHYHDNKHQINKHNDNSKNIYLSYKHKNIPSYVIPNWLDLNPDYKVYLYDNNDCIEFLREHYGEEYVNIFNFIKDGPIKSDFWRCCILYKFGGVYSDIDVNPIMPIDKLLEDDLELLTVRSDTRPDGITPELVICKKNNKLLKLCINTYLKYMREKKKYSYWSWSIVHIMRKNIRKILTEKITKDKHIYYDKQNRKYKLIDEIIDQKNSYNDRVMYKNKIVLYNRYRDYKNHDF